ncbi:MAG TPA: hypothetical protein VMT16_01625, partial [Thermoanaerobaculia bacterium]|nr:hypothetical protein [Thermoanaerobaculia bacterium]
RLRKTFEGVIALLSIAEGRITRIDLLPLDLQFDAPGERRGRPQIAAAPLGKRIIEHLAQQSRRYGTRIRYDAATNRGEVEVR